MILWWSFFFRSRFRIVERTFSTQLWTWEQFSCSFPRPVKFCNATIFRPSILGLENIARTPTPHSELFPGSAVYLKEANIDILTNCACGCVPAGGIMNYGHDDGRVSSSVHLVTKLKPTFFSYANCFLSRVQRVQNIGAVVRYIP